MSPPSRSRAGTRQSSGPRAGPARSSPSPIPRGYGSGSAAGYRDTCVRVKQYIINTVESVRANYNILFFFKVIIQYIKHLCNLLRRTACP